MSSSISLSEVFILRMNDLRSAMNVDGGLLEQQGSIKWAPLYSDKAGSDGKVLNGLDPAEFVKAFNRDDLNQSYAKVAQPDQSWFGGGGFGGQVSYRDAQVYKVQLDLLAGMERDLRMRYRSKVRMLAHGSARMQSHGLPAGPVTNCMVNFVKLLASRQD